jgi:hypothetical protein
MGRDVQHPAVRDGGTAGELSASRPRCPRPHVSIAPPG